MTLCARSRKNINAVQRGQSHKRVYFSVWIGLNVRRTEIINCQDWLLCLEMELGDDVCREVEWGNGITVEVPQIKKICQSRQKRYSYLLFWFWFSLEYQCWRFKLETTEYETGWPKIPSLTCGCELWLSSCCKRFKFASSFFEVSFKGADTSEQERLLINVRSQRLGGLGIRIVYCDGCWQAAVRCAWSWRVVMKVRILGRPGVLCRRSIHDIGAVRIKALIAIS